MTQSLNSKLWNNTRPRSSGPYIKTEQLDGLFDLRMCFEKPFLGHSHPIVIQSEFDQVSKTLGDHFSIVGQEDYLKFKQQFDILEFNELDLLNQKKVHIKSSNVLIEEQNLIGFNGRDLFQHNLNLEAVFAATTLLTSDVLIYSKNSLNLPSRASSLFFRISEYLKYIIDSTIKGKDFIDFNMIDDFLSKHTQLTRNYRYLTSQTPLNSDLFLKNGLVITKDSSVLHIPLACTNEELLDILNRIENSI